MLNKIATVLFISASLAAAGLYTMASNGISTASEREAIRLDNISSLSVSGNEEPAS